MKRLGNFTLKHDLGLLIKKKRLEKGFTQQYLGETTGLNRSTISLIENGVRFPSYESLDLIANGLGNALDEFLLYLETEEYDIKERLSYLTKKLMETGDEDKIFSIIRFIETL